MRMARSSRLPPTWSSRPRSSLCSSPKSTVRPSLRNPRSVVLAGSGSQATIVETHTGLPGEVYCTNAVTEVILEAGANVAHYKVQDEAGSAFHLALLDVRQGPQSSFSSHVFALGAHIARHEVGSTSRAKGRTLALTACTCPGATSTTTTRS